MTHPDPHDQHDLLLVAALADRDVDEADRQRAEALVAACPPCASLAADLRVLATATRDLPPVQRPRDFRLGEADAARLRHPSPWRRLVAAFGSGRDTVSRPLALGFTTLGLAGLLIGSVPSLLVTAGASPEVLSTIGMPMERQSEEGYDLQQAPAGEDDGQGGAPAAPPEPAGEVPDAAAEDPTVALAPDPTGVSGLIVVSGSLLIVGLGLFALRWSARRFGDG